MNQSIKKLLSEVMGEAPILSVLLVDVALKDTVKAWSTRFEAGDPNLVVLEAFLEEVQALALQLTEDVCGKLGIE